MDCAQTVQMFSAHMLPRRQLQWSARAGVQYKRQNGMAQINNEVKAFAAQGQKPAALLRPGYVLVVNGHAQTGIALQKGHGLGADDNMNTRRRKITAQHIKDRTGRDHVPDIGMRKNQDIFN